jgi:hypothetical protein
VTSPLHPPARDPAAQTGVFRVPAGVLCGGCRNDHDWRRQSV